MKTDLRYSASECFETFPFPPEAQLASLEPLGQQLYDARAAYLLATDSGLTTTYNQLKDPHLHDLPPEHLAALLHLRHLHEQLDRAVLAAYGWSDLTAPPFCPATPADRAALALFEDLVIDRLFALNATRAAAEARTLGLPAPRTPAAPSAASAGPRKPRAPKPRSRNQTSLLDED
ncbi:MAG: hypothetical protein IPI49_29440 [Myxococcales bacterium]|nr:hypothetical protein [Myxococcales bacterium]